MLDVDALDWDWRAALSIIVGPNSNPLVKHHSSGFLAPRQPRPCIETPSGQGSPLTLGSRRGQCRGSAHERAEADLVAAGLGAVGKYHGEEGGEIPMALPVSRGLLGIARKSEERVGHFVYVYVCDFVTLGSLGPNQTAR